MSGMIGRSGRKSKSTEQEVLEKLSLLDDLFFIKLEEALIDGKSWALKLFASHRIPKPTTEIQTSTIEETPLFEIIYKSTAEIELDNNNKLNKYDEQN
jgi:hypothetical protein